MSHPISLIRAVAALLLFFTQFTVLLGQEKNVEFRERNFPGREKGFKVALEAYKKGDYYFLRGPVYFPQALEQYLAAQEFNPDNADLNYQIGLCYLSLKTDRLKSLPYLERARNLNPALGNDFLLALGNAYQYNLDFDKAILVYEAYKEGLGDKATPKLLEQADKFIAECHSGKELIKKPVRVRIDNLGPNVNSRFPDYAPALSADENKLLFTSRRDETTGKMVDPVDSLFFEDIYITYRIDGEWAPAKNIGKPINKDEHDASVNLSNDGKKLLIYRTANGGDLYESTQEGIAWSDPRPLKEINTKWYENHATYSADGKYIFFVSDRKDSTGLGGKDIYIADVAENGTISNVRNAGEAVNTKYDEDGVFFHNDGKTLYFSSKGHNTMGGYDIFKSTFENNTWSKPENIGFPVNSPDDDVFFILSADGQHAYFSSYREEGFGDKDIYRMSFIRDVELLASVQISISDTLGGKRLTATLEVRDLENDQVVISREIENGETIANLPAGKTYHFTISSPKYLPYTETLEIPFEAGNQVLMRSIELSRNKQIEIVGSLSDKALKIPLQGEVEFQDMATREVVKISLSDRSGQFRVMLPPGRNYIALVKASNYILHTDTLLYAGKRPDSLSRHYRLTRIDRSLMSQLVGRVYDASTGNPVETDITITEFNNIPVIVYKKPGTYDCIVFNGAFYTLEINADGYMSYTTQLSIPYSTEKLKIEHDVPLVKVEKGAKMVLNNIFFDFDKSTLRPSSYKALNMLLNTLQRYPGMEIEISGHTDNIGSMAYNQKLSENRAAVVKAYLVRNGIPAKRITSVGRSFRSPIATNDTDEGRQLNRRTEIKILKK